MLTVPLKRYRRLLNDDETDGVKNLVLDTFRRMWFDPDRALSPQHVQCFVGTLGMFEVLKERDRLQCDSLLEMIVDRAMRCRDVASQIGDILKMRAEDLRMAFVEGYQDAQDAENAGGRDHRLLKTDVLRVMFIMARFRPSLLIGCAKHLSVYLNKADNAVRQTPIGKQREEYRLFVAHVAELLVLLVPTLALEGSEARNLKALQTDCKQMLSGSEKIVRVATMLLCAIAEHVTLDFQEYVQPLLVGSMGSIYFQTREVCKARKWLNFLKDKTQQQPSREAMTHEQAEAAEKVGMETLKRNFCIIGSLWEYLNVSLWIEKPSDIKAFVDANNEVTGNCSSPRQLRSPAASRGATPMVTSTHGGYLLSSRRSGRNCSIRFILAADLKHALLKEGLSATVVDTVLQDPSFFCFNLFCNAFRRVPVVRIAVLKALCGFLKTQRKMAKLEWVSSMIAFGLKEPTLQLTTLQVVFSLLKSYKALALENSRLSVSGSSVKRGGSSVHSVLPDDLDSILQSENTDEPNTDLEHTNVTNSAQPLGLHLPAVLQIIKTPPAHSVEVPADTQRQMNLALCQAALDVVDRFTDSGLINPMDTISAVFCLSFSDEPAVRTQATRLLKFVTKSHTETLLHKLEECLQDAFSFLLSRYPGRIDLFKISNEDLFPVVELYQKTFRLKKVWRDRAMKSICRQIENICDVDRLTHFIERLRVAGMLESGKKFVGDHELPSEHIAVLQYLQFISCALISLPFGYESEALNAVFLLNQVISLKTHYQDADAIDSEKEKEVERLGGLELFAVSAAVRTAVVCKRHLRSIYGLTLERCQSFDPLGNVKERLKYTIGKEDGEETRPLEYPVTELRLHLGPLLENSNDDGALRKLLDKHLSGESGLDELSYSFTEERAEARRLKAQSRKERVTAKAKAKSKNHSSHKARVRKRSSSEIESDEYMP
eukprot:GHVR01069012.1.p1 GENE.GHVR01069012.1~~GHVR01069012.1.p1  ORF type:complete len:942 (+),score=82.04 GHVR01069012.1:2757-5582(+)